MKNLSILTGLLFTMNLFAGWEPGFSKGIDPRPCGLVSQKVNKRYGISQLKFSNPKTIKLRDEDGEPIKLNKLFALDRLDCANFVITKVRIKGNQTDSENGELRLRFNGVQVGSTKKIKHKGKVDYPHAWDLQESVGAVFRPDDLTDIVVRFTGNYKAKKTMNLASVEVEWEYSPLYLPDFGYVDHYTPKSIQQGNIAPVIINNSGDHNVYNITVVNQNVFVD